MKTFALPTVAVCLLVIVYAVMATDSVPAQDAADSSKPAVSQWEYKVVAAPRESTFIRGRLLDSKLDELGLEGWECVGTINDVHA